MIEELQNSLVQDDDQVTFLAVILLTSRKTLAKSVIFKLDDSTMKMGKGVYPRRWDVNMMTSYCWSIKLNCPQTEYYREL